MLLTSIIGISETSASRTGVFNTSRYSVPFPDESLNFVMELPAAAAATIVCLAAMHTSFDGMDEVEDQGMAACELTSHVLSCARRPAF